MDPGICGMASDPTADARHCYRHSTFQASFFCSHHLDKAISDSVAIISNSQSRKLKKNTQNHNIIVYV
jgi:hypothetical protein